MSDETMIKEGQSPGKYSKTVPALLAAGAPRGDTIYAWNKTEENLCECSTSTSSQQQQPVELRRLKLNMGGDTRDKKG